MVIFGRVTDDWCLYQIPPQPYRLGKGGVRMEVIIIYMDKK